MSSDNLPALRRRDPVPATYQEAMDVGATLAASGFFADAPKAAQAAAKVIAGMELGLGPMASLTGIHMVQGKITLAANTIAALIARSGKYRYRVGAMEPERCEIVFYEGDEEIGRSKFDKADAIAAGLWGKTGPWKQHPRNMLFARAMSNGAKWYCPDVFAGPVYTPDELGAQVDGETGEVLSLPTVTVGEPVAPDPAAELVKSRARELVGMGDSAGIGAALKAAGISSAELADDEVWEEARRVVTDLLESDAPETPATIDAAGMRKVHAAAKSAGLDHDAVHDLALEVFPGIDSTKQVPADQVDAFLAAIETRGAELAAQAEAA